MEENICFSNSCLSIPTVIDSWLHLSKRKVNLAAPWQEAKASKDDAKIANRFQTSQGVWQGKECTYQT